MSYSTAGGNMGLAKYNLREIILNIADVALKIKYKNQPRLCRNFKKFTVKIDPLDKAAWHLDSISLKAGLLRPFGPRNDKFCEFGSKLDVDKKLSGCVESSFFDDPVRINLKNKRITHFHSNDTHQEAAQNSRLITYAYSQALAPEHGMLLHAAAVIKNEKAFLFLGPSGAGKSTAASLSVKHKVIADDVVAVRRSAVSYEAFPTPWKQAPFTKDAEHSKAEAKAFFFIRKSSRISFKPISPDEALKRMLYGHIHFLIYTPRPLLDDIFAAASGFVRDTPAYDMEFTKDEDFWPELEEVVDARR